MDRFPHIPCFSFSLKYLDNSVCVLSHFRHVQLFATLWIIAHHGVLCPWGSPGKNTGVGFHALLRGNFPTQGSNLHPSCFLHWQVGPLSLAPPGKSLDNSIRYKFPELFGKYKPPLPQMEEVTYLITMST